MSNTPQKLQQIIQLNLEIAGIQELEFLLEKILSTARMLVNADAGCIYLKEDAVLQCRYMQNDALQKTIHVGKNQAGLSHTVPINHGSLIGYVASTGATLTIPEVSQWPGDAPCRYDRWYDETFQYHTHSLLIVPLKYYQDEAVGVLYLINARNDAGDIAPFAEDDLPVIQIFTNHVAIPIERAQTAKVRIEGLIRLLTELHDPEETEGHLHRIGAYAAEIYRLWAYQKGIAPVKIEADAETLRTAAMLHDLGKLAIPQQIRQKPEKFTAEEFEIMKHHTIKGAQMLLKSSQSEYEDVAVQIALNHHECWNGTGYPGHLNPLTEQSLPDYVTKDGKPCPKQGAEIPIFGRVVAVADVYDALSCKRVHRAALPEEQVLQHLQHDAGQRFDPDVLTAFFSGLTTIRALSRQFADQ